MTATQDVTEESQETAVQPEILLPDTNIITHCVLKSDAPRLVKSFEDEEDPFRETVGELLNQRDDEGKSPLDLAATLGRVEILRELLHRGADVNSVTRKGYCALHHASAWGQVNALKVLVEFNANLQQKNAHGERARETASRYSKTECVDFLDWAEAKVSLLDTIKHLQETMADPEKVQGRLTKDDKVVVLNTCKEKNDWVENTLEATTNDFIMEKREMDENLAAIVLKLSEEQTIEKK